MFVLGNSGSINKGFLGFQGNKRIWLNNLREQGYFGDYCEGKGNSFISINGNFGKRLGNQEKIVENKGEIIGGGMCFCGGCINEIVIWFLSVLYYFIFCFVNIILFFVFLNYLRFRQFVYFKIWFIYVFRKLFCCFIFNILIFI